VLFNLPPVFPGALGSVLRHVVGSTLLQTERTDAEVTVVLCTDMTPDSLASYKMRMAVRTLVLRLLSVVIRFGKVSGNDMALERRGVCTCTSAVLTSIHV
jgi:hypothetical protein